MAYNKISSSQDPKLKPLVTENSSAWTDGFFEIGITLSYGAKNSSQGLNTYRVFNVRPDELFEISYTIFHLAFGAQIKKPNISGLKMIDFYNNPSNTVEFDVWDLNSYANQWQLKFEEVDTTETHTDVTTATNKYNANFSLEPSTGILKKIGLKFGASYEQSQTNTYTTQYTDVSDNLGLQEIYFYDNVVNMINGQLVPRKYNTGSVEFEFRPRLVY